VCPARWTISVFDASNPIVLAVMIGPVGAECFCVRIRVLVLDAQQRAPTIAFFQAFRRAVSNRDEGGGNTLWISRPRLTIRRGDVLNAAGKTFASRNLYVQKGSAGASPSLSKFAPAIPASTANQPKKRPET
jgi:hypothetical protein